MAKKRAPREQVLTWLDEKQTTAAEAARVYGYAVSTVQGWLRARHRAGGPPPPRPPPRARHKGGRRGHDPAPARLLTPDDRARALKTVRGARRIAEVIVGRQLERLETDSEASLSRDEAQALLNLQRTAQTIIDTHPGLMELAQEEAGDGIDDTERRNRIRRALLG